MTQTIQSGLANPNRPTIQSSHDMLISTAVGVGFVVGATLLAGISDSWGNAMLALMVLMFLIQAVTNADMFASFIQKTNFLQPPES